MEGEETPSARLQKLFQQEANTHCLHCGRVSKQWAQLSHAIFLCLDCAAAFREYGWVTRIKSVHLDEWTNDEVERMERGGNQKYGEFLRQYGLELSDIRGKVTSKASLYYRNALEGTEGHKPSIEEGRLAAREDVPLGDMSAEEVLQSAKEKVLWLGGKTKELGSRGVRKVKEKWESGAIQQGAKSVASTVSTKAQWLWGKVRDKVVGKKEQK